MSSPPKATLTSPPPGAIFKTTFTPSPPKLHLPPFNPTTSQALADRVRTLQCSGKIHSHVDFCEEAGVRFGDMAAKGRKERLSRWINHAANEWDLLGEENYIKIATHLITKYPQLHDHMGVPIFSMLQAPMYHAMAPFLNIGETSNHMKQLVGHYELYKASARTPVYFYKGLMEVKYDEITGSVTTKEFFQKSEREYWDITGTIYPVTSDMFIMLTVDPMDTSVRIAYISERILDKSRTMVNLFTGWIADTDQRQYFTTPLYAERIDNFEGKTLEFIPIAELPSRVMQCLGERSLSDVKTFVYKEVRS